MKFFRILRSCLAFSIVLVSAFAVAGSGGGTSESPNPTGGFGSEPSSTYGIGNPTGGFGDFTTLSTEEPPSDPPPPGIPLDAGASILIVSGLALGGRQLLKSLKSVND